MRIAKPVQVGDIRLTELQFQMLRNLHLGLLPGRGLHFSAASPGKRAGVISKTCHKLIELDLAETVSEPTEHLGCRIFKGYRATAYGSKFVELAQIVRDAQRETDRDDD